jgi:hypothetical protein
MGIMNVIIEALGVVINFFVKRDAKKKVEGTFGRGWEMKTDVFSAQKPNFMSRTKDGKYEKLKDDQLEQLDGIGDEIGGQLDEQEK